MNAEEGQAKSIKHKEHGDGYKKSIQGKAHFIYCEKCGKKIIQRLPNGLFKFVFGKRQQSGDKTINPPVVMYIKGSINIQCLARRCQHMNSLTFLPQPKLEQTEQVEKPT